MKNRTPGLVTMALFALVALQAIMTLWMTANHNAQLKAQTEVCNAQLKAQTETLNAELLAQTERHNAQLMAQAAEIQRK